MPDWKGDEYLEFEGEITATSGKAVQFLSDYWDEPQWLPRSQIEIVPHPRIAGDAERFTVRIKSWLCKKNGWTEAS